MWITSRVNLIQQASILHSLTKEALLDQENDSVRVPLQSSNSQSREKISSNDNEQGEAKRIKDWRAEMKFPVPDYIKQQDEENKMTNWKKISHFILFEKNFETTLDSIRAKRGLQPLKRESKGSKKTSKTQKKFDTFMDTKKKTAELLKDKNLPENFIDNILNILKVSIFNFVVKGLKKMGKKIVLKNKSKKRAKRVNLVSKYTKMQTRIKPVYKGKKILASPKNLKPKIKEINSSVIKERFDALKEKIMARRQRNFNESQSMLNNDKSSLIATTNYLNNSFYDQNSDMDKSLLRTENKMSSFRPKRLLSNQKPTLNQNSSGNLCKNQLPMQPKTFHTRKKAFI
ncbi:unnamed protein product [Moneuplotes crassus]|uniref:Uncharacterized protein n=1 Tax=Euplotes crassus TaxID=5936 RepID=A0AAD1UE52_EUPCR|nr:unnamed protein product [Moneuplotes crassus]